MRGWAVVGVVALVKVACASPPTPTRSSDPHVFIIVMENHSADLAGDTPRFVWITSDRCHDTHDCEISEGDDWLRGQVAEILASKAWKSGGVLFLTYDEDDSSSDNRVLTVVAAPGTRHATSKRAYDHYSLLATIEDMLGVGRLGKAAGARPM